MKQNAINSDIALEIQFRHMPKFKELKQTARQQLDTFRSSAVPGSRCAVVFDQNHSSKHEATCRVTTRLHIPGQKLYVTHTTAPGSSKEQLFAALNDTFHTLHRQMRKTRTKRYHHRRIAA